MTKAAWSTLLLATLVLAGALAPAGPDVRPDFEKRAAAVEAKDADGLYRLALWAKNAGLKPEAKETFARILHVDSDHRGARKALGFELIGGLWLRGDAAMRAKGFVRSEGEWVLAEEMTAGDARVRAEEEQASKALVALASPAERTRELARRSLAGLPRERLVRPCMLALERAPAPARLFATQTLRSEGTDEALTALIRTSIMDTSPDVRKAATQAVAASTNPDTIYPYLRALESSYAPVRLNAAQAIGQVGDIRGVETIIRRLVGVHGGGPRVNLYAGTQVSYIRDFDVEIAQAAQIGDPIIGTIQEGVVLDVKVFSVEQHMTTVEKRVLYESLVRITGEDHGQDTAAWVSWWKQNRERLLKDEPRRTGK